MSLLADAHDAASDGTRSKAGSRASSRQSPESTPDQVPRHLPMFEPIQVEDAKARAAVEQWRTFTMLLEPQPGSQEAAAAFAQLTQLAEAGHVDGSVKTRFTIVTKESLTDTAKKNGISGKRALAQAMQWIMTRDMQEGLLNKRKRATEAQDKPSRSEDDGSVSIQGDEEAYEDSGGMFSQGGNGKVVVEPKKNAGRGGMPGNGEDEDAEDEVDAIARKLVEREQAKLEMRAVRLLTILGDDLAVPDRVYILKGFPATDADAAQFLEENHSYFAATSTKKRNEAADLSAAKTEGKREFLSMLDAVVQLTTKDLGGPVAPRAPSHDRPRPDSPPGTASSTGSTCCDKSPISRIDAAGWEGEGVPATHRKPNSVWERARSASASIFTHASGVTKALALAQAKGGTVWQDLSFCYVNVLAPEDATAKINASSENSPEGATGKERVLRETKDILRLTKEFTEMVTQMAYEMFDFHQWFSTAELITLPRRDNGLDLARAVAEAKTAATRAFGRGGGCAGGTFHGSAARMKGSLWASDPALLAYSDLMLAVPEELSSVATALHCIVEAVMLDCTGTRPKSLETSPPAPLQISCSSNSSDECVTFSVASVHSNGSAPVSDGFLAPTVHGSDSTAFHGRILPTVPAESAPNNADAASVSTLASSGACTAAPSPPSRNLVIEFGDYAGERVTRSALSRAAASSADRVDPRAVVSVERSAISKLQNPRLRGHGALPREPLRSDRDRGEEQCELLTFTSLGKKDVDRTRQVWALERLVNGHHPPPGKKGAWNFENRRYWDVLPPHVVPQVLREENGTEPRCIRQYYSPTDELLVALCHVTPPGRACVCSWDPSTSGSVPFKYRPAFKDWACMALPKDSSYTPRTICALGAIMDVSKADVDRAKTKSVKVFPAGIYGQGRHKDHAITVLRGFVVTGERWLSTFYDGHVMGLRLTESDQTSSRVWTPESSLKGGTRDSQGGDTRQSRAQFRPSKYAARFTMGFNDDSRIVVAEGIPAATSPPPSASKGTRKSTTPTSTSPFGPKRGRHGGGRRPVGKPDGLGTISCVHTFPTGLVVTTGSDGTVRMEFIVDAIRDRKDRILKGFAPKAASEEFARVIVGRGTVVRYMRDGSTQALFVTGDVLIRRGDEETLTDKFGRSFRRASTVSDDVSEQTPTATSTPPTAFSANGVQDPGQCWIPIPPLIEDTFGKSGDSETRQKIRGLQPAVPKPGTKSSSLHHPVATATRDVETGAVVYSSPGGKGAVVVLYRDGVTVTSHADGTVQRWRSGKGEAGSTGGGLVLVECPGFVSVEVDVEIQEMCTKHAEGKTVAITRGGNRVRLRAAMLNGGVTLVTYDTRSTSEVCGRVVYVHPDNTEVIASDKGEVVVRPRGLWEGSPVHDILAGLNSSMPPNKAQPDLLVGTYRFDCLKGVMESEDTDRNRFVLDVTKAEFLKEGFSISKAGASMEIGASRPSSAIEQGGKGHRLSNRPSSGKGHGVLIDLAGETTGVRSTALVGNPLEPRLFVYKRDRSALELLRNDDAKRWCDRHSLPPPTLQQQHHERGGKTGGIEVTRGVEATANERFPFVTFTEEQCRSDPLSLESRQLIFHVQLNPMPRGKGYFTALLKRGAGRVFGEDFCEGLTNESCRCWRTRSLPLCAKVILGRDAEGPSESTAVEACVRRVWVEHPPLSKEASDELRHGLAEWRQWKRTRAEIDRFSVTDPRPKSEIEAQSAVQTLIRKAYREAKVAKQKQRDKERAARAVAGKEQQSRASKEGDGALHPVSSQDETLQTSSGSRGVSTMGTSAFSYDGGGKNDDEDEYDLNFTESGDEEEDPEIALMREESASAYRSAGGESIGYLDIPALRLAMITVLGRSIKQNEAEKLLFALRKRTFVGQKKASATDLFHILDTAKGQPWGTTNESAPPRKHQPDDREVISEPSTTTRSEKASQSLITPTTTCRESHRETLPFWDTPLGRSIGDSTVTWALGASVAQPSMLNTPPDPSVVTRVDNNPSAGDVIERDVDGTIVRTPPATVEQTTMAAASTTKAFIGKFGDKRSGRLSSNDIETAFVGSVAQGNSQSGTDEILLLETIPPEAAPGERHQIPAKWKRDDDDLYRDHRAPECWVTSREEKGSRGDETGGARMTNSSIVTGVDARLAAGKGAKENGGGGKQPATGCVGGILAQGMGAKAIRSLAQGDEEGGVSIEETPVFTNAMGGDGEDEVTIRAFDGYKSSVFEVSPSTVCLGRIELGRSYPLKLHVVNMGARPGRFRVNHNFGGNEVGTGCRRVSVGPYPRGNVAAGLTVTVRLRLVADRLGELQEILSFVAEDGYFDAVITAEVIEADSRA